MVCGSTHYSSIGIAFAQSPKVLLLLVADKYYCAFLGATNVICFVMKSKYLHENRIIMGISF